MKCIRGRDILSLAEVRVNKGGIIIKRYEQSGFLGSIILTDKNEVDVDPTDDTSVCEEARNLLLNYTPKKTKSTNIKLNINVKDNKPVFS